MSLLAIHLVASTQAIEVPAHARIGFTFEDELSGAVSDDAGVCTVSEVFGVCVSGVEAEVPVGAVSSMGSHKISALSLRSSSSVFLFSISSLFSFIKSKI